MRLGDTTGDYLGINVGQTTRRMELQTLAQPHEMFRINVYSAVDHEIVYNSSSFTPVVIN